MSQVTIIETNTYTMDVPDKLSDNEKQEFVIEEWNNGFIDDPICTNLDFVVDELENIINNYHYYTRLYSEKINNLRTQIMKEHKNICDIQLLPEPDRLIILTTNPKLNYVIKIKNKQQVLSDIKELLAD